MARTNSPLHDLQVASPCSASWEQMEGDNRVRFCDACALNVYNLSAMTAQEAERLVARKEGRLCVRFFQREDGTVMTQDCPRGLAAVRRAARRAPLVIGGALAAMFLLLFGLVGAAVGLNNRNGTNLSNVQPFKTINGWLNGSSGGTPTGVPVEVTGEICPQEPEQPDPAPPQ
jgi:hypothetical protein